MNFLNHLRNEKGHAGAYFLLRLLGVPLPLLILIIFLGGC